MKSLNKKETTDLLSKGHEILKTRFIGYSTYTIDGKFINKNSINALLKQKTIVFAYKPSHGQSVFKLANPQ